MPKVKILKDLSHPDYGFLEPGDVVVVSRDYVRDYEALGFAEEVDEGDVSRAVGSPAVTEMPEGMAKRKAKAAAEQE